VANVKRNASKQAAIAIAKKKKNKQKKIESKVYKYSARVNSTKDQARIIRSEALSIIEKSNEFSTTSRRVNRRSAFKVISRSLHKTEGLPFSIRKHQALSELSDYISLAKHNKVNGLTAFNTDLLPISHPRSTRAHAMTASAVREAYKTWVLDDPNFTDETARALVASAMSAPIDSPEHIYSVTRLENLDQGLVPVEAMVAAYGDGNSRAARSARANLQRRDRLGRFAEMFGALKLLIARRDGSKASLTGRIVGQNIYSPELADVELSNGRIVAMPISQAEQPDAYIEDPRAKQDGFVPASPTSLDSNAPVISEADLTYMDIPSGFHEDKSYSGPGKKYTDDAYDVVVFDAPSKDSRDLIDKSIARRRERDLEDPIQKKLGENGKLWDENSKVLAVSRRNGTPFAFTQTWNDALQDVVRDEPILDDTENRPHDKFDAPTEDQTVSLVDSVKGKPSRKKTQQEEAPAKESKTKTPEGFKYEVPEGSIELDPDYDYIPEGSQDDPSTLAAVHQTDELMSALEDGLTPEGGQATGLGRLEDENGDEFEVPVEAILSALKEQGEDPEAVLAQTYDMISGFDENLSRLNDHNNQKADLGKDKPKKLSETFDEVVKSPEEPVSEEEIADLPESDLDLAPESGTYDDDFDWERALSRMPLIDGLTDEEKDAFRKSRDFTPYLSKNKDIQYPEGMTPPSLDNVQKGDGEYSGLEAAIDIASSNMGDADLIEQLQAGVEGTGDEAGYGTFLSLDENNELVPELVSSEAIRDALKLRGRDTDSILQDIADGKIDLAGEAKADKKREDKKWRDAKKKRDAEKKGSKPIAELPEEKPSIAGQDPLTLDDPFKPEDWVDDSGPFADLLKGNEDFSRLEGLGQLTDIDSPLYREYQENSDSIKEITGEDYGDEVDAIDMSDYEGGPSGKVEYALKILNEPAWSLRGSHQKLATDKGKISALKDADKMLEDALGDLKTDKMETDAINSVRKSIADEIAKLSANETPAPAAEEAPKTTEAPETPELPEGEDVAPETTDVPGPEINKDKSSIPDRLPNIMPKGWTKDQEDPTMAKHEDGTILDLVDKPGAKYWFLLGDKLDQSVEFNSPKEAFDYHKKNLLDKKGSESKSAEEEIPTTPAVAEEAPAAAPTPPDGPKPEVKYKRYKGPDGEMALLKDGKGRAFRNKDIIDLLEANGFEWVEKVNINGESRSIYAWRAKIDGPELKKLLKKLRDDFNLDIIPREDMKEDMHLDLDAPDAEPTPEPTPEAPSAPEVAPAEEIIPGTEGTTPISEEDTPPSDKSEEPIDPENPVEQDFAREALKELIAQRKEIQNAIDEADLNKDVTPEERKALREVYDEISARIDEIVNGFSTDQLAPKPDKEVPADVEKLPTPVSRRMHKKEQKRRKELLMKILYHEYGRDAFLNDFPQRREVKNFLYELDTLTTSELEDIGRLINEELGWKFFKKLKPKSSTTEDTTPSTEEPSKPEATTPEAEPNVPEVSAETEITEVPADSVKSPTVAQVTTPNLQPGDVTVDDHFTITNVVEEGTKKSGGQEVKAYRITGYYPNSVEQSTKLWGENVTVDVYRNVEIPEKGDLPELSKPKPENYGTRIVKEGGKWYPSDPTARKQFEQDMEKYDEELASRMEKWNKPENAQTETPVQAKSVYTTVANAADVQPGDVAYKEENGKIVEAFVIEEVLSERVPVTGKNGVTRNKVQVKGHYSGHQTQIKEWYEDTPITVVRGDTNLPAAGELPALDRPDRKDPDYKAKDAARTEAIRKASEGYNPEVKVDAATVEKPKSRPQLPAFMGSAEELAKLGDGKAIKEALKGKRVVVFDFETIGTGLWDAENPDAPVQVAANVYENGEKVDSINLYMNPGQKLGAWYYDENGNLKEDRMKDSDGNPITDEWLATQPSVEEQLKKLVDFFGKDAILVAYNAGFDINTLERWAEKLGIDFTPAGSIDPLPIVKAVDKLTKKGDNTLSTVAKRYGIETPEKGFHDASADIDVTWDVLNNVLDRLEAGTPVLDASAARAQYDEKLRSYNERMDAYKKQISEIEAKRLEEATKSGKTPDVDAAVKAIKEAGSEIQPTRDDSRDPAPEPVTSIYGDKINTAWVLDDDNTYVVNAGGAIVGDLQVGDFIEGKNGSYVEVIDLRNDPDDPDGTNVIRRDLETGLVYEGRETEKRSPGQGWSNGKTLRGDLRRRKTSEGKTAEEIKSSIPKSDPVDNTPEITPDIRPTKGSPVTDEQVQSVVADAIETITSGSKTNSTVDDAVKDLNLDETIKSDVVNREGSSDLHLSADGTPLKVGDKVRNTKNGRIGTVKAFISEYGSRKYKNYVKVKFDDAVKRENASAGSLEIINDDGGGDFFEDTPSPDMGMALPEGTTSKGLVPTRVDATELKVGDRLDISGKTRVTAVRATDKEILAATKTRGSRGGGIATFPLDEKVKVWRAPEDVTDTSMGMALPDMGAVDFSQSAPDTADDPDYIPTAVPEDNYEYAGEKFPPTPEQRDVVTAIMTGEDVVVRALAGSGKTSTLKLAANRLLAEQPDKKIVYVAFNKTVQTEAEAKMPKNVEARTGDSIAFQGIAADLRAKFLAQKGKSAQMKLRAEDIADELGIKPVSIKVKGTETGFSSREIPAIIKQAVNAFSISDDDNIMPKHFPEELDTIPPAFLEYANAYWDDLNDANGVFGFNNAHITKIWALTNPDLGAAGSGLKTPADVIFFDEAQDINPVIAKVIASQSIQKVYVGDGNQAIYAFRGAEDQLDKTTAKYDLPMTKSFRFGPEVAGIANRFLAKLGSKYRVEGAGPKGELVDGMEDPDVVITRTNSGGFKAMIELLEAGKTVGITKATKDELESLVNTASWLISGKAKGFAKPTMHPDLAGFSSWDEVKEAVEKGEAKKVKSLYDMIVQNGIGQIKDVLNRVQVISDKKGETATPTEKFVPTTLDKAQDGAKGSIGNAINYNIEGTKIFLSGNGTFKGKDTIKNNGYRWEPTKKQWYKDVEDDLDRTDAINKLRKDFGGYSTADTIDVVVTTAHKAKGLEWDNVRIYSDFWGPRVNKKTGEEEFPAPEELRLAYVALTRAQKKLDPGALSWIYDYTSESDETKRNTPIEDALGMAVPTDPMPVTEAEFDAEVVKASEKVDPATEKIADAIIAALEAGVAPWRKPWTGGGMIPTSVASGKQYEGSNIMVLWSAMIVNEWSDNRFLTFKQAQKLGGSVKKGEKGTQIIHWIPKFKKVEQPDGTTKDVFVFSPPKVFTVFNVEQTEGVNLPPVEVRPPVPVTEAETLVLDTYKDRPEVFNKPGDAAFYSPILDTITLPDRSQFPTEKDYFETLVHELAHSTGHSSRVNRTDLTDNYGTHKESRAEEELIAEISVSLVAARLGVEIDFGNVAAYAQSWLNALKNDKSMIVKASKQAQKAVDYMLGKQKGPEVDAEGNPIGEGVGSEGMTGEQIAEDAGLKPETPNTPNIGSEGKSGEEIAKEKTTNEGGTV
jgi:antirestriction protein ArdC/DNA polymerase III epsilon subunit-like protein